MKNLVLFLACLCCCQQMIAQNVGIGTALPKARLHVVDSSVVFSADGESSVSATIPIGGAGRRMMWYAPKAAFRAGYVGGDLWNRDSIGLYSFAAGKNAMAKGEAAIALGTDVSATGKASFAMGKYSVAKYDYATALGYANISSGFSSLAAGANCTAEGGSSVVFGSYSEANGYISAAFGEKSIASGHTSFAAGYICEASGWRSMALGNGAKASAFSCYGIGTVAEASADYSVAIGSFVTASGEGSMALGSYASTNGYYGTLVIGDRSTTNVMPGAASNTFRARFANGYRFFTSSDLSTSAYLAPGANAWSTGSSVYIKENFKPVDGESFLQKIKAMNLTSWNYIGQDKSTFRHYGPMAQDFYAAFGNDGIGTIGEETSINQADFDGVNLVAIQALEKRTASQATTILALQEQVAVLTKKLEELLSKH